MGDEPKSSRKLNHEPHDHGHDHGHGHDHDHKPVHAHAEHGHGHSHAAHSHDHDHADAHSHGLFGGHHHHHAPKSFGLAFAVGISLNLGFVVIEGAYGFLSNSLALLSDAGHNLSDVLGLFLAWFATWLARKKPSAQFTYGLRSSSILAAVINAVVLLVAVCGIIWESILRFGHPSPIQTTTVMIVAAIGILVNGITAALFASGSRDDLNIRGAFLHMLSDALVSLGVVIAGFLILKTGYEWIDPVVSILIGLVIMWGTWGLLKDSVFMALAGVPNNIDTHEVEGYLRTQPGVNHVHDLHIWALSTSQTALTAHLVCSSAPTDDSFLLRISSELRERFGIGHATIQVERGADCPQDSDDCL